VSRQMQDFFDWDLIKPAHNVWCSPRVLVKKKDGSCGFCV